MKHTIEFWYDGCRRWGYNGGYVIGESAVISYIGQEAFNEAMKHGESFRVTMDITIETIGELT
jgi:hypothetical protein